MKEKMEKTERMREELMRIFGLFIFQIHRRELIQPVLGEKDAVCFLGLA